MITLQEVSKSYQHRSVLQEITLSFGRGKVTALLGPNGSGKSTLIKCILGLVSVDQGFITVDGEEVETSFLYREKIGYMAQRAQFPSNLRVGEVVTMVKDIRGKRGKYDEELLEAFKLSNEWDKPLRALSGGTKQKLNATVAFLFSPEVLILDEPTASLDPLSVRYFKDKVLAERQKKRTIIITSHVMSEIEELCDEVVYLTDGKVRVQGTVDHLKEVAGEEQFERAIAHFMEHP